MLITYRLSYVAGLKVATYLKDAPKKRVNTYLKAYVAKVSLLAQNVL